MSIRNRVLSLRDLVEWTDVTDIPDGTSIIFEGGQFVLVPPPASGSLVDSGHATTPNPDLIDAGNATATNPDTFDGGSA